MGSIHGFSVSLKPLYKPMQRLNLCFPISCFLLLASLASSCNGGNIQATHIQTPTVRPFRLTSPAFTDGSMMPALYTCDSTNISPELRWNNPFNNVVSFALIMDDPDVPTQPWVHWLVYNIPATDTTLPSHFAMDSLLSNGVKQGFTSFKITGYGGPCPPNEAHRYYFKLYALDTKLNAPAHLTKSQLLNAMNGHILAEAVLMGKYARRN